MKIRQGFVSNSSSSSFVVNLKTCKEGKDSQEFLNKLEALSLQRDEDDYYGWFGNDSGRTDNYSTEGNFVEIGSWYAPNELWELVEDFFDKDNILSQDY